MILVERRERVAIITINRPEKRNALNIQTRAEGAAVLDELRADDSVRVVIITGAGDKAFIAGADIAEFAERTAITQREVMLERSLFNAIDGFPKPIIAMVNGYCLGGGCEVALACDIRIASEKASFGQPEINLGIIPGGGGTQRLTRLIGEGKSMELILTGEIIDAQNAFAIGLVNHVVPADQLEKKTMGRDQRPGSGSNGRYSRRRAASGASFEGRRQARPLHHLRRSGKSARFRSEAGGVSRSDLIDVPLLECGGAAPLGCS